MENIMTNGFCELTAHEMEKTDGGYFYIPIITPLITAKLEAQIANERAEAGVARYYAECAMSGISPKWDYSTNSRCG